MVLAISDPTGTFKFYNKRSSFRKCNRKKAAQTMAGVQNSSQACWNFGWFCHHQRTRRLAIMMTLPKERSVNWMAKLEYGGISDCFAITELMITMMTFPIEGSLRMAKRTKGKCGDGFKIERNDERPTNLLPSSFLSLFVLPISIHPFFFLSTHSSPPPCRLALAVGNKLSC